MNRTNFQSWRAMLIGLLILALVPCRGDAAAATEVADVAFDLTPRADVDESLFLIRALEELYNGWPRSARDNRDALAGWLTGTRDHVSRLRAHIRAQNLDARLTGLYDDCLKLIDAYERFLIRVGAIDETDLARKIQDRGRAFWDVVITDQEGGFTGWLGREIARETRTRAQIEAEVRVLENSWSDTMTTAAAVVEALCRQHGWARAEAGFDDFQSTNLLEHRQRRPRDPFAKVEYATTPVDGETHADVIRDARLSLAAARMVPAGSIYDGYRTRFVRAAAERAIRAAELSLPAEGRISVFSDSPSEHADEAVQFCRTLLTLVPDDDESAIVLLGRALAYSGRFGEAIAAFNSALATVYNDRTLSYFYARLCSITNQLDLVGGWLERVYALGASDVAFVRNDPNLENFRRERPQQYRELTSPTAKTHLVWGIFMDDIAFENTSPFALTNVTLEVTIVRDGRTWSDTFKAARVEPGATHTFSNVFSIPRGPLDRFTWAFSSDQDL